MCNDKHLLEALAFENRASLPKPWKGKGKWSWIRAIALVRKVDGTESYAVIRYNGCGYSFVKTFGSVAQVAKTVEIYPTLWLDPKKIPTFENNEQAARYACLCGAPFEHCLGLLETQGKTVEQIAKDRQEFGILVFNAAAKIVESDEMLKRRHFDTIQRLASKRKAKQRKENKKGCPHG